MTPETNKDLDLYDFNTVCTMCECQPGTHVIFNSCPIMDGFPICATDCCMIECLKPTIAEKFSKVIGKEITLENVNEACKNCGKNYAKQNPELAKQLENEF